MQAQAARVSILLLLLLLLGLPLQLGSLSTPPYLGMVAHAQNLAPVVGPDPEMLEKYLGTREWVVVGEGSIRAFAKSGWRPSAENALAATRHSLPRIAAALGVAPEDVLPIWIIISPGGGRFSREAPSWSAAIARPLRNLMVLSGPALERTQMNLQQTVAHELAHLVVHTRIGDFGWMPLWLNEGLAVHLSEYNRLRDRLMFWGRGPIHLQELTDVFPRDASRARLAYLESAAAVRRLLRLGTIAPLLDRIQAGDEFEDAFQSLYGQSSAQFADNVYDEVARHWRYLSVLTSSVTLFGALSILFIVAGVRRKLRDRRRMQEWEREEKEQERSSRERAARLASGVADTSRPAGALESESRRPGVVGPAEPEADKGGEEPQS